MMFFEAKKAFIYIYIVKYYYKEAKVQKDYFTIYHKISDT